MTDRKVMFAVLVVNAVSALYNNAKSAMLVDGSISEPFEVYTGVLR